MSVYVYRRSSSTGARSLADAIEGQRFRGRDIPIERKVRPGDVVICWGESCPDIRGVRVLNGAPLQNKYEDAIRLLDRHVATVQVQRQRPRPVQQPAVVDPALAAFVAARELAEDFVEIEFTGGRPGPFVTGVNALMHSINNLTALLGRPVPAPTVTAAAGEWFGRLNNHVGGNDLLTPTPDTSADYFVKKEMFVREYRIHSFRGRSIRAGMKTHREGFEPTRVHPWIRSWDGGWRIVYDGVTPRQRHREIAHAAVEALGLDFGAVDIGEREDESLVVLEVNRAPGVELGTVDAYARAIQGWINGEEAQRAA